MRLRSSGILLLAVIALSTGCRVDEVQGDEVPPAPSTSPAVEQRVQFGPVVAAQQMTLVSLPAEVVLPPHADQWLAPPWRGRVVRWRVATGDVVTAKTPLADMLSHDLATLDAEIDAQRGVVAAHRRQLRQRREQVELGMQPITLVQEAQAALSEARAQLRGLEARRDARRKVLDTATIDWTWRANAQGVVERMRCPAGTVIEASDTCIRLVDTQQALLRVHVPERLLARVDDSVTLTWYPAATRGGAREGVPMHLVRREPHIDPRSRTRAFLFAPVTPSSAMIPGATGRADLVQQADAGVLRIPRPAMTYMDGKPTVFVASASDANPRLATPQTVQLVGRDHDALLIRGGVLLAGDRVAVRGVFLLKSLSLLNQE